MLLLTKTDGKFRVPAERSERGAEIAEALRRLPKGGGAWQGAGACRGFPRSFRFRRPQGAEVPRGAPVWGGPGGFLVPGEGSLTSGRVPKGERNAGRRDGAGNGL